ncbi:hypothetical protein A9Q87_05365 [Flavobacteriales bacterium 34_180_T64]|nr:hypothetical protein A9Q87_05365 [Flavobacteriales bacterium 34_180_T64]
MENYKLESHQKDESKQRFIKEEAYIRARKKLDNLKGFYWHLASYIVVNIFLIVLIGVNTGNFWHFGTFATAIFWGIGLLFHFLGIYGPDFFFGKNWEERKIKEIMDKEKRH